MFNDDARFGNQFSPVAEERKPLDRPEGFQSGPPGRIFNDTIGEGRFVFVERDRLSSSRLQTGERTVSTTCRFPLAAANEICRTTNCSPGQATLHLRGAPGSRSRWLPRAASGISAAASKAGKCALLTGGQEVDIRAHMRRFAMHFIEHGVGGVRRVRAILIYTGNGSDHAHRR